MLSVASCTESTCSRYRKCYITVVKELVVCACVSVRWEAVFTAGVRMAHFSVKTIFMMMLVCLLAAKGKDAFIYKSVQFVVHVEL